MKFAKRVSRLQRYFTRTMAVLVVMKALAKKNGSRVCVFRTWPTLERKLFLKKLLGTLEVLGKARHVHSPRPSAFVLQFPHTFSLPTEWPLTVQVPFSCLVNSQALGINQVSRLPFSTPFRNCREQRSMLRHVDTKFLNVDCLKPS